MSPFFCAIHNVILDILRMNDTIKTTEVPV